MKAETQADHDGGEAAAPQHMKAVIVCSRVLGTDVWSSGA